jgi:hypothetical protein
VHTGSHLSRHRVVSRMSGCDDAGREVRAQCTHPYILTHLIRSPPESTDCEAECRSTYVQEMMEEPSNNQCCRNRQQYRNEARFGIRASVGALFSLLGLRDYFYSQAVVSLAPWVAAALQASVYFTVSD